MKTLTFEEIKSVVGASNCVDYSAAAGAAVGYVAWGATALLTDGGIAAIPGSWAGFSGVGGIIGMAAGDWFCG